MKLRAKVLAAGACTAAVILCLTYLVAHLILLHSFEALEARQTAEHMERAIAALAQRIDHLAVSARDWAAWDDTYVFALDRNAQYAASNLVPSTLSTLNIDVLAYVDPSGNVIRLLEGNPANAAAGLGVSLIAALWTADGGSTSSPSSLALSGTLRLPQGLATVASHPILRSDLSGPSRGALVMARLLDDEQLELLSDTARLPIEILPPDAASDAARSSRGAIDVRVLDAQTIGGFAPLHDVWGRPVGTLSITLSRDVYARGRATVTLFLAALALGTILPIGAAVRVLQRRVAGPVADLSAFVDGVRQSGDLGARAPAVGCGEITSLGHAINTMLEALQGSEEGLQQSEERYRSLVDNLHDVIYTIGLDGTITYASPAVSTITGLSPGEVMGQPFTRVVHPDDHDRAVSALEAVLAGGSHEDECRLTTASGDVRWARYSAYPQIVDGHIVGLQGILTDVTERRHLEEQLRQVQKMEAIGQLAEGIAHDFNNLLTIINGYAASALQAMGPRDPLREDLTQIRRAGEQSAELTRRLLTFGRRRVGSPQVIAIGEALAQTSAMLQRLMGGNVSVVLDLPEDPLHVQAEPGQIEQILVNLAANARDAMPHGGTLTIRARREATPADGGSPAQALESSVVLAVHDTGCGMTPEVLEHAFEPFYTTKEGGRGTGLGLTTVYGIVRQNRGTVVLDSTPGEGTTVTIRLPAAVPPAAQPSPVEPGRMALPGGSERVLLVEDQPEVRRLSERLLRHLGYHVEAWSDPAQALARYCPAEHPFDLVLTDVAMPEISGPELVARLKERDPGRGFAVVFMSGYTEDSVLRRGALGANERFMQKPFTAEQLATVIRSALDRAPTATERPGIAA